MTRRLIVVVSLLLFITSTAGAQDNSGLTIHVVQRGENLFRIALHYGMTTEELARLNGITNVNSIQVGQRLLVPMQPGFSVQTHTVQPGETLQSISTLYGVSIEELSAFNNLANPNSLAVGQLLNLVPVSLLDAAAPEEIPQSAPISAAEGLPPASVVHVPASSQQPTNVIHTVLRGETLFRIATAYGTTVNAIVEANTLTGTDLIYAGQTLLIPNIVPPQLAIDLPAPVTGFEVMPLVLVEGQTGRFRLTTSAPASVSGTFLDLPLNFVSEADGTRHTVLVGVPIATAPGTYPLALTVADSNGAQFPINANIQVVAGGYLLETDILLLEDRDLLLNPAVENAELDTLRRAMAQINHERHFEGAFGLPAAATITSSFGNSRSYNGGIVQRVHAGTDFGGMTGTPIFAAAPGRVVLADTLNVRGMATVIDHGWGVYTGYWHQSERYVGLGEIVTAGQTIGAMGDTGLVSGPHLHWEVWVNGVPVDPMQWTIFSFS